MTEKQIRRAIADERNAYMREWRKNNRDKVKEANSRYWRKRVERKQEADNGNGKTD